MFKNKLKAIFFSLILINNYLSSMEDLFQKTEKEVEQKTEKVKFSINQEQIKKDLNNYSTSKYFLPTLTQLNALYKEKQNLLDQEVYVKEFFEETTKIIKSNLFEQFNNNAYKQIFDSCKEKLDINLIFGELISSTTNLIINFFDLFILKLYTKQYKFENLELTQNNPIMVCYKEILDKFKIIKILEQNINYSEEEMKQFIEHEVQRLNQSLDEKIKTANLMHQNEEPVVITIGATASSSTTGQAARIVEISDTKVQPKIDLKNIKKTSWFEKLTSRKITYLVPIGSILLINLAQILTGYGIPQSLTEITATLEVLGGNSLKLAIPAAMANEIPRFINFLVKKIRKK